jgi:hypothetical protein
MTSFIRKKMPAFIIDPVAALSRDLRKALADRFDIEDLKICLLLCQVPSVRISANRRALPLEARHRYYMLLLLWSYTQHNSPLPPLPHLAALLDPRKSDYVIGVGAGGAGSKNSARSLPGGNGAVSIAFLGKRHSTTTVHYCFLSVSHVPNLVPQTLPGIQQDSLQVNLHRDRQVDLQAVLPESQYYGRQRTQRMSLP